MNHAFLSHRLPVVVAAFSITLLFSPLSPPVNAQDRASLVDRLEQLERQVDAMNRYGAQDGVATNSGAAQLDVRLTELEEEVRRLHGRIEEIQHQQQRVSTQMDGLQKDLDARLNAMEARLPAAAATVIGGAAPAPAATPFAPPAPETPVTSTPASPAAPVEPMKIPSEPAKPEAKSNFPGPREHYDAAFKALNQSDYKQASQLFADFVQRYPNDNLIGNAYYWLGETYYVQQKYAQAADQFRRGFESMSDGPKAPDNLLKLSMSLSQLNRQKEACVVLGQLMKKYAGQSEVIERKAKMESAKLHCES